MKRFVFYTSVTFVIIAVTLILVIKPKKDSISILSLETNYSRVMTESEILSVSLYLNDVENFFVDTNSINRVSISDEYNEIVVGIKSIDIGLNPIKFQNLDYYEVTYNLSFDWDNLQGLVFNLECARMNIRFVNEVTYDFELGNLNLDFMSLDYPNYIDISRMYGIVNDIEGSKTLVAVALKLENLTNSQIIINNIESNDKNIGFNLENANITKEIFPSETNITVIFSNYYSLKDIKAKPFILDENSFYVFPLINLSDHSKISRIPIYIDYLYQNTTYKFVIDDFLFFNEGLDLDANQDKITEYIYNYS